MVAPAEDGARPSRTRRRIALCTVPVLALGALAWVSAPAAQAAPDVPVPYRIGYAGGDVPVLAAVLPAVGGGNALPAPDRTRPAEDPSARGGGLVFVTHRPGHRDGDLRFRASAAGTAVPVLDDDFDDRAPELSPDGRTIVFESDREGQPDIFTIGVDGRGLRRITDHPGDDRRPTWSPTGDRIAFSSTRDDPAGDIHTVVVADGTFTRVAPDPAADSEPAWAPTGVLAFTTTRFTPSAATAKVTAVAVVAPDVDTPVQRLVNGEQAAWSPDGRRLAYVTRAADPAGDVGVISVLTRDTSLVARRPAHAETHPSWAGQAVAYEEVAAGGGADVWSADPAGQDRRDHTQRPAASETAPAYTVDGTRLAYAEEASRDDPEAPFASRIVAADAEGGDARPVSQFVPGQVDDHPAWSPDGAMIAFSRQAPDRGRSVVIVSAESGAEVGRIPVPRALRAEDAQPAWSPDGRRIAFERRAVRRAPGKVIPGAVDRRLNPGGSFTVDQRVLTPAIPPKPDIVLLVDTTGSMADPIADVQANLRNVIGEVRKVQPDARFAVAGFKDVADKKTVYTLYQGVTDDADAIQRGIAKLTAEGGGDDHEDWGNALVQVTGPATGFRPDSSRVVVLIGDAPTHDPSNGYSLEQSIAELQRVRARVVAVDLRGLDLLNSPPGCRIGCQKQATRVVKATGGEIVKGVAADQVSTAILNGLRNLIVTVTPEVRSCDKGLSVSFRPPTPTKVRDGNDVHYQQTVTIGPDAVPGTVLHCLVAYPISPNPDGDDEAYLAPVTVRVNDPAQPLVTVDDITVESADPAGAVVEFGSAAIAADGTVVPPVCVPPSGTRFPIGQTTVTCTAVDRFGVTGQDTALITVVDPGADQDDRIWVATLAADPDGPVTPVAVTDMVDVSVHAVEGCRASSRDAGPAFAPDGAALAFTADGDLCVTDPGGRLGRLLTGPGDPEVQDPAWSPDSVLIAYTSVVRGEPSVRSLRTVPAAGGPSAVLVETPGQAAQPAFRPLVSGLTLTVTATPQQTVEGDPAIRLTYTATNPTTAPAGRVWLSSVVPSRDPVAAPIGVLPPGTTTTLTVEVDTATPLAGTVHGTVTGLFPGDVPASAVTQTDISVTARPVTDPPPPPPPPSSPVPPPPSPPAPPPPSPPVFTPVVRADPPIGPPGFVTLAVGSGFPARTPVELEWEPGITAPTRVTTGADGTFRVQMLVFHKDRTGPRALIVSGPGFAPVQTSFLVVQGAQQPADWVVRR